MDQDNQTITRVGGGFLGKDIFEYTLVALAALISYLLIHFVIYPVFYPEIFTSPANPAHSQELPPESNIQGVIESPRTASNFEQSPAGESNSAAAITIIAITQIFSFVVILIIMRLLILWFRSFEQVRLKFDARARFEGRWLEVYFTNANLDDRGYLKFDEVEYDDFGNPDTEKDSIGPRYSVFDIVYNSDTRNYTLTGTSYFPNALFYSYWWARAIIFHPNENRIDYLFASEGNGDNSNVKGSGTLSFRRKEAPTSKASRQSTRLIRRVSSEKFQSGIGSFVENSSGANRYMVEFIRITDQEIDKLVPERAEMHPAAVLRKFVQEYHKQFGKKLAGGLLDPINPVTSGTKAA